MERKIIKDNRIKVNYTTSLPVELIDDMKRVSVTIGKKMTSIIEDSIKEYFANHNLLADIYKPTGLEITDTIDTA